MAAEPLVPPILVAVGLLGQACFFSRFFVQWLASERAHHPVVPRSFWWLSLSGALLMSGYALARGSELLLYGFAVGGALALRNLCLRSTSWRLGSCGVVLLAAVLACGLWMAELADDPLAEAGTRSWWIVGLLGQALWTMRFPVQWALSERAGKSHFPLVFWWLSLAGNALLLAYALHLGDPVFVLGFLPGPLIHVRNLMLARGSSVTA